MVLPRGKGPRNARRRNMIVSFVFCMCLCLVTLSVKVFLRNSKTSPQLVSEGNNETVIEGNATPPKEPENDKKVYKTEIIWEEPNIPKELFENKTKPIVTFGRENPSSCKNRYSINNNIKYTKLTNVCLNSDGAIINETFEFVHKDSCSDPNINLARQRFNRDHAKKIGKAVFVAHNQKYYIDERILMEFPLLSLLPEETRDGTYTLITSDLYTVPENEILNYYGYKDLLPLTPNSICCDELYIVDGPSCQEYSPVAVDAFAKPFLVKTGFYEKEPKHVVIAHDVNNENEEINGANALARELDEHFGDVTFYMRKKLDNMFDRVKFFAGAKVVIASYSALDGNEIWMQNGSVLFILQEGNSCYSSTVQFASDHGVEVHGMFFNTKVLNKLWAKDIIKQVEEVLIEKKLTLKNKSFDNEAEGDIF